MSELIKKLSTWSLYFFAVIVSFFSTIYIEDQNLIYTLSLIFIALASYSFLIIRNKSLSGTSYVTLILFLFYVLGCLFPGDGGIQFPTAGSEKMLYLIFGPLALFVLSLFIYLATKQQGWKQKTSFVFMVLVSAYVLLMGTALPNFHNNFVYTRILIGVFFIFSVLLIFTKKNSFKVGGIIGIIASIMALLLSAMLFSAEIYNIEGVEKEEVLSFISPKAQEMLQFYNQKDFDSFCKDCGEESKYMFLQNIQSFLDFREMSGRYLSYEEPEVTFSGGLYYVEYSTNFENIENPIYYLFVLDSIRPEDKIYGFSFSSEKR